MWSLWIQCWVHASCRRHWSFPATFPCTWIPTRTRQYFRHCQSWKSPANQKYIHVLFDLWWCRKRTVVSTSITSVLPSIERMHCYGPARKFRERLTHIWWYFCEHEILSTSRSKRFWNHTTICRPNTIACFARTFSKHTNGLCVDISDGKQNE